MSTHGKIWSDLNTEPICTIACRIFDMAPHIGTFLMLVKVSERCKKICLPWPRRWAGPCYRVPRYYIHEAIRLFLVLFFFYHVWFQGWFAVAVTLMHGYGYGEHRVKRNIIPGAMLVVGIVCYVVCWCGFFGRKQDGSFIVESREPPTNANPYEDPYNDNNNTVRNNVNPSEPVKVNNNNNVPTNCHPCLQGFVPVEDSAQTLLRMTGDSSPETPNGFPIPEIPQMRHRFVTPQVCNSAPNLNLGYNANRAAASNPMSSGGGGSTASGSGSGTGDESRSRHSHYAVNNNNNDDDDESFSDTE